MKTLVQFINTLFFSLLITNQVHSQIVTVAQKQSITEPEEPCVYVNRTNPSNIIIGANVNNMYVSNDSGKTWFEPKPTSNYGIYGDPCIISNPKGQLFYFHLSDPAGQGWENDSILDRIVCQRSDDFGKTWGNDSYVAAFHPKDQDKEWAAMNFQDGSIHLTWTQFDRYNSKKRKHKSNILYSSSPDGTTWTSPIQINRKSGNCKDNSKTAEGAVPTIGPNGEIYVSWSYHNKIYFTKSMDRGISWPKRNKVAVKGIRGWNFSIPGFGRANGLPITICDTSNSPDRGAIYINWADQRNGKDDTDIWISKSIDKGNTWSSPKKVNTDSGKAHQFFTWMSIDQTTGFLYVIFYDRRNSINNATDVYLATSRDGGITFENKLISEESFTPNKSSFMGDYISIDSWNRKIYTSWTHATENTMQIKFRVLEEEKQ